MNTTCSTTNKLAIHGGKPVRQRLLPQAEPNLGEAEIAEVIDTLRSGQLVTGRKTRGFEARFARYVGQRHAVAMSSGAAAMELALEVAGVGEGDEVITTPLTFVATPHAILHRRATPVLADIDPATWNLDPERVEEKITSRTRAIVLVHFAGRPCDMQAFTELADRHGLMLISDSGQAIEARCDDHELACWSAINAYSFHPIRNLTTGEGGMVTTDNQQWAERLQLLRLHGMGDDPWGLQHRSSPAAQDVTLLGRKCNMTDVQASLGLHQLRRLDERFELRERLWNVYNEELANLSCLTLPAAVPDQDRHARHLYSVLLDLTNIEMTREEFRAMLRAENIGTGYHYRSIHQTTFYREQLAISDSELPNSTYVSDRIVSLPLHAGMTEGDARSVVEAIRKVLG